MGEAENLRYQNQVLATWRNPKPSLRLDTKRLELENADLCKPYKVAIQNSRRLVIKATNEKSQEGEL